jgi:hypothetical protein
MPPTSGSPPWRLGASASLPRSKVVQSVNVTSGPAVCDPLTCETFRMAPLLAGEKTATNMVSSPVAAPVGSYPKAPMEPPPVALAAATIT